MKTNVKKQESGRSMVEMLGVLAIIGVLSVGGIAGYTMAMNKHRANEILNAASVRAMMVSAKLQQNSTADITNALAEFGNETIAGASFTNIEKGTGTFTLTLSGVSSDVCDQMKNIVGENGIANIGDCPASGTGSVILTYNTDLSAPVVSASSGGYDGPKGNPETGCEPSKKMGGASSCQECMNGEWIDSDAHCTAAGSSCVDGTCKKKEDLTDSCPSFGGTCTEYNYCAGNYAYCASDSDCQGSTYDATSGMCVRDVGTDETACAKNSDCASGEFCNYHSSVSCETGPNGKVGKCEDASAGKDITKADYTKLGESDTWFLSNDYLDWFSAKNFCLANHMQMVSLADTGCTDSTCATSTNDNSWDVFEQSGSKLGSIRWQTKDLTNDSCCAYYVSTSGSYVYNDPRDGIGYYYFNDLYALCK